MTNLASLDEVIREFIQCPLYDIREDGTIWTYLNKNGSGVGELRRMDRSDSKGFYRIVKYKNRYLLVHRVVYSKFIGALREDLQINHINGIKDDNRPENLELVTCSVNQRHGYRVLKNAPRKGHKKIAVETAEEIRKDHRKGLSYREIKEKYGICKSSISYIINYKTWC